MPFNLETRALLCRGIVYVENNFSSSYKVKYVFLKLWNENGPWREGVGIPDRDIMPER